MRTWELPSELSSEVLDRLGVGPPTTIDDVSRLIERIGSRVPSGSTAKLQALERGRRPAGEDPVVVAEGWLADPHVAWTCWASSSLTAALVHTGPLRADILGVRRTDARSPAVDVHSVVAISAGDDRWICDPHFGVGPISTDGGRFQRPGVEAELTPTFDDRFDWAVRVLSIPGLLQYRSLTQSLASADVAMFCDISVTHSGLTARPSAMVLLPDGIGSLRAQSSAEPSELRLWQEEAVTPDEFVVQDHESWDAGMNALLLASHRSD